MIKGFKIRIYPTKEQEDLIRDHINACRFIWNYMLALQKKRYEDGEKHLSAFDMIKLLTPLKKAEERAWLRKVSNASLQNECKDLAAAYENFFKKRSGFPKFKAKKKAKPAFPVRSETTVFYFIDKAFVKLPKIGRVKYKSDFQFPCGCGVKCGICNVRISFTNGKYMLSFGMECENQASKLNDYSMGIDLGVKELAVVACGDQRLVFHNINKSKKVRDLNHRIKYVQRSISRKYEASKKRTGKYAKTQNILREENKLRKLHARVANIRHDYLHQTTAKLISMLPSTVVMEDLNVSGMMKNKHLSKAVTEQCFYEFIRQMQYKCEWNGIEFIQVSRFYPSSKTCSYCGSVKHDLKLSDRVYVCPDCGLRIDRDYNAAINLMRYGTLPTQVPA